MRLLVDGMNVIGSRPDGWWKDRPGAMRMLIDRLRSHASATGDSVAVFLDARPFDLPEGGEASVEVVFAFPGPDAADDEIVKAARAERDRPGGGEIGVVTSDHGLADRIKALGIPVISSSAFRRRLDEEPGL